MSMQKKCSKKICAWLMVVVLITMGLIIQAFRTGYAHVQLGSYDNSAWVLVWPTMVSTLITVFGTLVTSYVFLKDALDRTIDEKPYYAKIIVKYREEKIRRLIAYSIVFVGISCYLILFQNATGQDVAYGIFLYLGIIFVVILLLFSLHFLYQCINIDKDIYRSAKEQLTEQHSDMYGAWKKQEIQWKRFIDSYIMQRKQETGSLQEFLEVDQETNQSKYQRDITFSKDKFIVKFSEWEKLIFLFLDKSSGFQMGQSVGQRDVIATGYIQKFSIVQKVEKKDAEGRDWESYAYGSIKRYTEQIRKTLNDSWLVSFSEFYQLLSDYRDTLQVIADKKLSMGSRKEKEKKKCSQREDERYILYIFFLLKFICSIKCLVTLPKVELFYPSAKMYNVDFYNVRFENTSFRASLFNEVLFARIKMVGSNMSFSKFDYCNFYNADIRDCSVSNALFENCLMSDMILSYVDVTGTWFNYTNLENTTFENTVVVNAEFHKTRFHYTSFVNCKLVNVDFTDILDGKSSHSNFEKSILTKVKLCSEEGIIQIPERYKKCDENYFEDLCVEYDNDRVKKRKDSDIWDYLEKCENWAINLSATSFFETIAEDICFQDMCLNASIFEGSDMQRSKWKSVCMKGCVMKNANLSEARFTYVNAESCILEESILYKAWLCLVNIQNSNLLYCHASESKWTCCALDKSDVSRIDLTKSVVEHSSFRDVIMTAAELTYAMFTDVLFENLNGRGILSSYSRFDYCSFVNAFLPSSNFNYTVFEHCNMKLTSMMGSTIEEADFIECDFENSNFKGCTFIKVNFKNNSNMGEEIFEGCTFIGCRFEGKDEYWEQIFISKPLHYSVI